MLPNNYFLVREALGMLFLVDLISFTPHFNLFFGKGYHKKNILLKNNAFIFFIYLSWLICTVSLISGVHTLICSLVLLCIFRHYYVNSRWKSIFRGGGAPGLMSYYSVFFIFLFELSFLLDSTLNLSKWVHTMLKIDFGAILFCAGLYKLLTGYTRGQGMEYGMVNPMWGYFHKSFKSISPEHAFFKTQNIFACVTEILMGIFLLIPSKVTNFTGAILCILSFIYLLPFIRLGRLAVLMMTLPLLFIPDLGFSFLHHEIPIYNIKPPIIFITSLKVCIILYLILLPFIKVMQYLNLFLNKTYPKLIQALLTNFANFVPIIMWRVFTADITNFFIRIYEVNKKSKHEKTLLHEDATYSYTSWSNLLQKTRFMQVAESITIASIFTTLKYFKSKKDLFENKLIQYSKTFPVSRSSVLKFQYVSIQKNKEGFDYIPVCNYNVDLSNNSISEERISVDFDTSLKSPHSPIKETVGFGSYLNSES